MRPIRMYRRWTPPRLSSRRAATGGVLAALLVWLLSALYAPPAAGQTLCTRLEPPCPDENDSPAITFTPQPGTSFAGADSLVFVTITWSDDGLLSAGTRSLTWNGANVLAAFSWESVYANTATSSGTLRLSAGTNTLVASICDQSGLCTEAQASYAYTPPPPPEWHARPQVSLAPHHSGFRDVTRDALNVRYTTPAYWSLDEPRAVTFLYSSGQAQPALFFQMDVSDRSSDRPRTYGLKARRVGSSTWETFPNGAQELFFAADPTGAATRLAGRFPAETLSSGAYRYEAQVTSYFGDGSSRDTLVNFRVPVINERSSAFGMGWSLEGQQRLYDQGDGVFIVNGDGTGVWFEKDASGVYRAPDGEFSSLTVGWFWTRTYPDGSFVRFYTGDGRMRDFTDRFERLTSYYYNASGQLTGIADPTSREIAFGYTGGGALAWVQDPAGRRVSTTATGSVLWRFHDPDGPVGLDLLFDGTTLLGYWERGVDRAQGDAARWHFVRDAHGQLAEALAPQVATTDAGLTRPTTRYTSLEAAVLPAVGSGTWSSPAPARRSDAVRTAVTSPRGHTTRFALDRFGQPTRIEEPLGRTTRIFRDAATGLLRAVEEPSGASINYDWGPHGNLTRVSDWTTGRHTMLEYADARWPTLPTRIAEGGAELHLAYGTLGELQSTVVGRDTTRYQYTGHTQLWRVTDPQGHTTEYGYQDVFGGGNLLSVTEPDATGALRTTRYERDAVGRAARVIGPLGDSLRTTYDLLNRASTLTDAAGRRTELGYTGRFLTSVRDAAGKLYGYQYNRLGWLERESDPQGRSRSYGYDRDGNPTQRTDRRGQAVSRTHDALGRLATETADGATTTFAYDDTARWVAARNAESTDTLFYDLRGRTLREVAVMGGQRFVLDSHHRKEGPRDTLRVQLPGAQLMARFVHDHALRLVGLVDFNGDSTGIAYDRDGLPQRVTLPGGLTETLGYTPTHRPQSLRWSASAANGRFGFNLVYDARDRLRRREDVSGSVARSFDYDLLGQVAGYTDTQMAREWVCPTLDRTDCYWESYETTVAQESYGYDAVGNRTDRGAALQPTSNRYASFGGYTLEYDAEGNLTRKAGNNLEQRFTWNALGQLTGVWDSRHGQITYGYNGFGERVRRTDPWGTVVRSVYDGDDLLLEVDASGARLREFLHYPGVDAPHSLRQWAGGASGATYYYATEYPGSVTGLVNRSGSVINEYRYDPWGTPQTLAEGTPNPLRFHAREADPQTGLYYVRARWYDPELARFVSEDPLGLEGGLNPYVFAGNSPVNVRDPSGLQPPTLPWGVSLDGLVAVAPARDWAAFLRQLASGGSGRGYGPGIFGSGAGGGGWGGGGSGGGDLGIETDWAMKERAAKWELCQKKIILASANVALDLAGGRLVYAAFHGAGRIAPQLGWSTALRIYRSDFARGIAPGLMPTSLNFGGAVATFDGSFNSRDALLFAGGFVPYIGSAIAVADASMTCYRAGR